MIKIGDTLEEFKKGFASGEYKLRTVQPLT